LTICDYLDLLNFQFSILGFTETWLHENSPPFKIDGYNLISNNRKDEAGGGVALYIHDSLIFNLGNDVFPDNNICESLFIKIPRSGQKNIIVGVIYKPPKVNPATFVDSFDIVLQQINKENKKTFIMGDFNVDLLQYGSHRPTQNFVNSIFSNYHRPLINKPTRITDTTATIIDNIISNNLDDDMSCGILFTEITDHFPIFQVSSLKDTHQPQHCANQSRRIINAGGIARFSYDLVETDWSDVLSNEDPNQAFNLFHSKYTSMYDANFPVQQVKSKTTCKL
jgi:hypothetical protein